FIERRTAWSPQCGALVAGDGTEDLAISRAGLAAGSRLAGPLVPADGHAGLARPAPRLAKMAGRCPCRARPAGSTGFSTVFSWRPAQTLDPLFCRAAG